MKSIAAWRARAASQASTCGYRSVSRKLVAVVADALELRGNDFGRAGSAGAQVEHVVSAGVVEEAAQRRHQVVEHMAPGQGPAQRLDDQVSQRRRGARRIIELEELQPR